MAARPGLSSLIPPRRARMARAEREERRIVAALVAASHPFCVAGHRPDRQRQDELLDDLLTLRARGSR